MKRVGKHGIRSNGLRSRIKRMSNSNGSGYIIDKEHKGRWKGGSSSYCTRCGNHYCYDPDLPRSKREIHDEIHSELRYYMSE